jgi:hypothetical protein
MAKRLTTFSKALILTLIFGTMFVVFRLGFLLINSIAIVAPIIAVLILIILISRFFYFRKYRKEQFKLRMFELEEFEDLASEGLKPAPLLYFGSKPLLSYYAKQIKDIYFHLEIMPYYQSTGSFLVVGDNEKQCKALIKDVAQSIDRLGYKKTQENYANWKTSNEIDLERRKEARLLEEPKVEKIDLNTTQYKINHISGTFERIPISKITDENQKFDDFFND